MSLKGIINLYKPSGISSAQAVSKVKKILQTRTVGHMGTLDPAAEGVLLIGVGKATRLFNYLLGKDKTYQACFEFGYQTDTLDREGSVVKTCNNIPSTEKILSVLPEFLGNQMQTPPSFSAKNINGKRSYELARQGKAVELSPSPITIYNIELIHVESPKFHFRICCSSGTYIRSICSDLAKKMNSCATMTSLKRTKCGIYDASKSIDLEALADLGERALIAPEIALSDLQRIVIPTEFKTDLDNGKKFRLSEYNEGDSYAVYCSNILYGIGIADKNGFIKIATYLKD